MLEAFTYAALSRTPDALPRLVELLPEPARSEVNRIAAEARGLSPAELASRIAELRAGDLAKAEAVIGPAQSCPARLLEWKYRRHFGER